MTVETQPVDGRRGLAAFIDVPWRLPHLVSDPNWVPPLRMMVRDNLDRAGNPFYRTAERALFIARRNGRVAGRIAAIENRAHNAFHRDRVGFFGFFECDNDPEVAQQLLGTAARWLAARGLTAMRGPMSPSTNHECGLLVDGFAVPPMFLTPWNPDFYEGLITGAGWSSVKDLIAYWMPYGEPGFHMDARFAVLSSRAKARSNLEFRSIRMDRYWEEVESVWTIYNSAWEKNWGFVPMSRDEFVHMARELKPLLDPRFAIVAEVNGTPAGFLLSVFDYNRAFKRNPSGRLLPWGLFHILRGKSTLRTGRAMALGVRPEYRNSSILALLLHESATRAIAFGAPGAEASWILEDNAAMRRPLESLGGRLYRRWRIFEKPIG